MAKFFEIAPVVGFTANGEAFVVSEDDVRRWADAITRFLTAGEDDDPYLYNPVQGNIEYGYYSPEDERYYSLTLGEGEFYLPYEFREAFCKRLSKVLGFTY